MRVELLSGYHTALICDTGSELTYVKPSLSALGEITKSHFESC